MVAQIIDAKKRYRIYIWILLILLGLKTAAVEPLNLRNPRKDLQSPYMLTNLKGLRCLEVNLLILLLLITDRKTLCTIIRIYIIFNFHFKLFRNRIILI